MSPRFMALPPTSRLFAIHTGQLFDAKLNQQPSPPDPLNWNHRSIARDRR